MSLDIKDLESVSSEKNVIKKEIKDFIMIFILVFWFWWIFINAQLLVILFDSIFNTSVSASNIVLATPNKKIIISKHKYGNFSYKKTEWDDMLELRKKILEKQLFTKLKWFRKQRTDMVYKPSYISFLRKRISSYDIKFNTLPPDSRLVVPKIWLDVHIVNLTNIPIKKIEKADYDSYLYSWVVKYPYTPDPDKKWNVFIFWHSSYYWWKHNPYWTVFSKLPALRHWDVVALYWWSHIYKYKIIKKLVLWPREVQYTYKKYSNWQYLSLMTCYPVWTDRQRMVIVAQKEKD